MENYRTEKSIKIDLITILAIVILARISCPALSNIPFFSMAFVFIYGVAFMVLFFVKTNSIKRNDACLILTALIYTLYIFFRDFIANKGLFARDSFNAYIIVFLTMILIWAKQQSAPTKRLLLKLIFACLIFDYVYSITVLFFDPGASRIAAATSVLEKSPYDILNAIGGFDAVYGGISVITISLFMRRTFKEHSVKNKVTFILLVLCTVFIVMAAYATALVLLILAIALFVGSKNKMLSFLLIAGIVAILVFHEQVGQGIIDLSKKISYSETISQKMDEFGYMVKTFETAGTYEGEGGRFARMIWSIDTFKKYPIFGGIGIPGAKVGGHSEILDLLGNFGLMGLVVISSYFICLYRNIKTSLRDGEMKKCFNIIMWVFIISSVLNPSLYSLQMVPIILMLPLCSEYVDNKINKQL